MLLCAFGFALQGRLKAKVHASPPAHRCPSQEPPVATDDVSGGQNKDSKLTECLHSGLAQPEKRETVSVFHTRTLQKQR